MATQDHKNPSTDGVPPATAGTVSPTFHSDSAAGRTLLGNQSQPLFAGPFVPNPFFSGSETPTEDPRSPSSGIRVGPRDGPSAGVLPPNPPFAPLPVPATVEAAAPVEATLVDDDGEDAEAHDEDDPTATGAATGAAEQPEVGAPPQDPREPRAAGAAVPVLTQPAPGPRLPPSLCRVHVIVHADDLFKLRPFPEALSPLATTASTLMAGWAHFDTHVASHLADALLAAANLHLVARAARPAIAAKAPAAGADAALAVVLVPVGGAASRSPFDVVRRVLGADVPRAAVLAPLLLPRAVAADLRVCPPVRPDDPRRRAAPHEFGALRLWPASAAALTDIALIAEEVGWGLEDDAVLPAGIAWILLVPGGIASSWGEAQLQLRAILHGRLGYHPYWARARGARDTDGGVLCAVPSHMLPDGLLPDHLHQHQIILRRTRDKDGAPVPYASLARRGGRRGGGSRSNPQGRRGGRGTGPEAGY